MQTTLSSDLKETYSDYKLIRCTDHIDPEIFFQEEVDVWSRNQDFTDIMVHNKDIKKIRSLSSYQRHSNFIR